MAERELEELYEKYVRITFNKKNFILDERTPLPYLCLEGYLERDTDNFVVLNNPTSIIELDVRSPSMAGFRRSKPGEFKEKRKFVAKSSILEIKVVEEPDKNGN
ncbi:hypothetical protein HYX16_01800 [Candidatus Woesearchaeota archaeon]|nr:hypothetical protein [Candidatus Woesearchaeota archaeon]